jgi:hypothetical protein
MRLSGTINYSYMTTGHNVFLLCTSTLHYFEYVSYNLKVLHVYYVRNCYRTNTFCTEFISMHMMNLHTSFYLFISSGA